MNFMHRDSEVNYFPSRWVLVSSYCAGAHSKRTGLVGAVVEVAVCWGVMHRDSEVNYNPSKWGCVRWF
jgi:hypothetical protein